MSRSGRVLVLACLCAAAIPAGADVHLIRGRDGGALIFNDLVGSGWRVNGRVPSDSYLMQRRNASTPYDDTIASYSKSAGVDPTLVKSIMLVESNYNPRARSRKGARGLMQLMPGTALRFGVSDIWDVEDNIRGGVRYLSTLLAMFNGNVAHALAAYNAGEGAVERYSGIPPYPETKEYVRRALIAYRGGSLPAGEEPVLGGGFKGHPVQPGAKVQVDHVAKMLSNDGPVSRVKPVLGRATQP